MWHAVSQTVVKVDVTFRKHNIYRRNSLLEKFSGSPGSKCLLQPRSLKKIVTFSKSLDPRPLASQLPPPPSFISFETFSIYSMVMSSWRLCFISARRFGRCFSFFSTCLVELSHICSVAPSTSCKSVPESVLVVFFFSFGSFCSFCFMSGLLSGFRVFLGFQKEIMEMRLCALSGWLLIHRVAVRSQDVYIFCSQKKKLICTGLN